MVALFWQEKITFRTSRIFTAIGAKHIATFGTLEFLRQVSFILQANNRSLPLRQKYFFWPICIGGHFIRIVIKKQSFIGIKNVLRKLNSPFSNNKRVEFIDLFSGILYLALNFFSAKALKAFLSLNNLSFEMDFSVLGSKIRERKPLYP